jgi:hypothetical protein
MPAYSWKILIAVIGTLAATASASAQVQPMTAMERTKETMRRLALPPDPALEAPVAAAFAQHQTCMIEGMKAAVRKGKKEASDLTRLACQVCDKTLVAREKLFFRANSHRYIDPNLDKDIETARKECPTSIQSVSLTWDIVSALDADPKENQSPPISVARFERWNITGETNFSGELLYKAVALERSNAAIRLEVICSPASKSFYGWLNYPLKPGLQKVKSLVTFATDGSPPDQISADVKADGFPATDLFFRLISPTAGTDQQVLFVDVQGIKLTFDIAGAPLANRGLVERCHL